MFSVILGHQRRDLLLFLVRQIRQVALGLACNIGHSAMALSGPHPELESSRTEPPQLFSNGY